VIDAATARQARNAVRCPHCRAQIGAACVVPSSGRPLSNQGCHPARAEALTQLRGVA
jgi:hypothetical protein